MNRRWRPTAVKQLNPDSVLPQLTVRLLKFWAGKNPNTNQVYSMDCIFVDKEGIAIEGSVDLQNADSITPNLIEGQVYNLKNFHVENARSSYSTVKHLYRITLRKNTIMDKIDDIDNIPKLHFEFEPFENIGTTITDPKSIVDIIGQIIMIGDVKQVSVQGVTVPLRDIEINDESDKSVILTLWGDFITQFDHEGIIRKSQSEPIIVIVSLAQLSEYHKAYKLKTCSGTKFYFDENIPAISERKKSAKARPLSIVSNYVARRQQQNIQACETITINELLDNYATKAKDSVRCLAKIALIKEAEDGATKDVQLTIRNLQRQQHGGNVTNATQILLNTSFVNIFYIFCK